MKREFLVIVSRIQYMYFCGVGSCVSFLQSILIVLIIHAKVKVISIRV